MRICPGPGSEPGHVYLEAVLKLAITYFKQILFSGGPLLEYKGFLDHNAFWIGVGPDLYTEKNYFSRSLDLRDIN